MVLIEYTNNTNKKLALEFQNYHKNANRALNFNNLIMNELPELPKDLRILKCSATGISNLPFILPNNLEILECSYCNFKTLPALPDSLRILECASSLLTYMRHLPINLEVLYCEYTYLQTLPELPPKLQKLNCFKTQISLLPDLPNCLLLLNISCTHISYLPELPFYLEHLDCSYTHISELPLLPEKLTTLNIIGTKIKKMPNIPYRLQKIYCSQTFMIENFDTLPTYVTEIENFCKSNVMCEKKCFDCFSKYSKRSNIIMPLAKLYSEWQVIQSQERVQNRNKLIFADLSDKYYQKQFIEKMTFAH